MLSVTGKIKKLQIFVKLLKKLKIHNNFSSTVLMGTINNPLRIFVINASRLVTMI